MLSNVMNFFNQNYLILQQNWLHIKRKNLSSVMTTKRRKLSMLGILRFSLWITESGKCCMKNRLFDESMIACSKIVQRLQHNIRPLFALNLPFFLSTSLNVFNPANTQRWFNFDICRNNVPTSAKVISNVNFNVDSSIIFNVQTTLVLGWL